MSDTVDNKESGIAKAITWVGGIAGTLITMGILFVASAVFELSSNMASLEAKTTTIERDITEIKDNIKAVTADRWTASDHARYEAIQKAAEARIFLEQEKLFKITNDLERRLIKLETKGESK